MAVFTPEDQAFFDELELRAAEQARALYSRRQQKTDAPLPGSGQSPHPPDPLEAARRSAGERSSQFKRPAGSSSPGSRWDRPPARGEQPSDFSQRLGAQRPSQHEHPGGQHRPPAWEPELPYQPPHETPSHAPHTGPRITYRQRKSPGGISLSQLFGQTVTPGGDSGEDPTDREWVLLALLLYILIREKADRELILAFIYILVF